MPSRRSFLMTASLATAAVCSRSSLFADDSDTPPLPPLIEVPYSSVQLAPGLAQTQFEHTQSVLLSLNEDSLLKPWRLRAGVPAPGPDLGGWYDEVPLDKTPSGGHGFAPAHSFGQWISALSRGYAINGDTRARAKIERLLELYKPVISGRFYTNFRFPAYVYDKMVIGLIDAHQFAGLPRALTLLDRTTDAAQQHLPPHAIDRDEAQRKWRSSVGDNASNDYTWDEPYTLAENLFLAAQRGAGLRYQQLAPRYLLDETWFDPLSRNQNVLAGHHAYSFCNSLCSAMQAYLSMGSRKHLRAASNAFDMITAQSFVTGGWGPDESFRASESDDLYLSLSKSHHSFETPCGSYAHLKLTRYLLRVTREGRYGDSMERVLYNTVLGANPLQPDGRAFYYSDYTFSAQKSYFPDLWPCCSGTLPQVAADYRLLLYFHSAEGLWVNLYLPSTLSWISPDGAQLSLTQAHDYPNTSPIALTLRSTRPSTATVHLRIPAWAPSHSIRINGASASATVEKGFASIQREWNDGDRIELSLDMPLRLEPIDPRHPETVALLRGPLVLFATSEATPGITQQQLLAARALPTQKAWQTQSSASPITLLPFTELNDQRYTTYLKVT
jgi:DUF1680 family protein